ncbi:MAG: endopeptidase La [Clostridia bacterium]|nr:endopeptidase La [Clostridia bacterium]
MPRKKKDMLEMPMIPLRGLMVFPHTVLHFDVGRASSVASLEKAMMADQRVALATQIDDEEDEPTLKGLYPIGMQAVIKQVVSLPGDALRVLVEGKRRIRLAGLKKEENAIYALCEAVEEPTEETPELVALTRTLHHVFEEYAHSGASLSGELVRSVLAVERPGQLADLIAANVLTRYDDRLRVLEETDLTARLESLCGILMRETELAGAERSVQARLKKQMDKNQKDYYLREQIRAIQEELGEQEASEAERLRKRAEELSLNDEAREKVLRELDHLARMQPGTPEITVSQNYIEWILDLPWGKYTKDHLDIVRARKVLDEDHYGLVKVKERIIEYLAVLGLKQREGGDQTIRGPILCFVGPPGVGKTSIVRGIAKALGRQFVQMSLGGVRDEAEIRGHRRTYVGAIPGRIISGMKQAGSMNPVFLFDEIDKMSNDFRGDPASAMLEVLDAEQNNAFRDHYMELPFDLSRVLFITTANNRDSIPEPLLDRMELIEVPSYTEEEKLQIAKRHLLRKELKEYGLKPRAVRMSDRVLQRVIEDYTREAGVRILTRTIGTVVRKAAVDMMEQGKDNVTVTEPLLRQYLGAARYLRDLPEKKPLVGVVNGLAYTAVGGETLAVECACMPGSGALQLTGQLGDVMKESARAALSWVRAHSAEWQLAPDFYKTLDIHIHVPEGAVPKDGPSAGVTMATALVSALTGRPVRQDVAMTGEITLRGRVLPIGGVKEKLLAAYRAGIRTILLPRENEKDLEEVPAHVKAEFHIRLTDDIGDVLREALLPAKQAG